jgi:hypothetical protein
MHRNYFRITIVVLFSLFLASIGKAVPFRPIGVFADTTNWQTFLGTPKPISSSRSYVLGPAEADFANREITFSHTFGESQQIADSHFVRQYVVHGINAGVYTLAFDSLSFPSTVSLFIYTPGNNTVHGPISSDDTSWVGRRSTVDFAPKQVVFEFHSTQPFDPVNIYFRIVARVGTFKSDVPRTLG